MTCWRTPRRLRGENGARVTVALPNPVSVLIRKPGKPGPSRHDGRHPDRSSIASERGGGARSRSRGLNASGRSQGMRFASFRSVSGNRSGGAHEDDKGCQRAGRTRSGLLQPMRRGQCDHSRRREALPQTGFVRGSRFFRVKREHAGEGAWDVSLEAGPCE